MRKMAIIIGTAVLAAGMIAAIIIIKKRKKYKVKEPLDNGLYTINLFKKITCDMNNAIADTEKRLADHDKLQKIYEEMEWKTSDN